MSRSCNFFFAVKILRFIFFKVMLHTKSTYCEVGNTDEWTDGHIQVTEKLRSLTIKIFLDSIIKIQN